MATHRTTHIGQVQLAAFELIRHGVPVFPLAHRSKVPLAGSAGVKDESLDAREIEAWPADSNVGAAMGHKHWTLDVDSVKGGSVSVAELTRQHGKLPRTVTAETPGGGWHLLWALPEGLRVGNRQGVLPGLDVRGSGGYLAAPPSVHPNGGSYRWRRAPGDVPFAVAPGWLLDLVGQSSAHPRMPPARPFPGPSCDAITRARAYVSRMPPAISGSGGHVATFAVATVLLRGFNLDQATGLELLKEYNGRCQPPWSEKELAHEIRSVSEAPRRTLDGHILNAERRNA